MQPNRNIQTGDLLFFRPTGWVGRLICLVTRSEYCHVGLACIEVDGDVSIREYREFGYREMSLEEAEREWEDKADVWRNESSLSAEYATIFIRSCPKEYGWFHFLWIGFFMLCFRWLTKRLIFAECDQHAPTCSEAVCRAYRYSGRELVAGIPDRLTSPGDIIRGGKIIKVE